MTAHDPPPLAANDPGNGPAPYVASGRPDFYAAEGLRPGWSEPAPREVPRPTFWPAVMGLAIAVGMWGIMLDYLVLGVAAAVFIIACIGWIGEIIHE